MPRTPWLHGSRMLALAALLACIAIGCATGAANAGPRTSPTAVRTGAQQPLSTPAAGATPQVIPSESVLPPVIFWAPSGARPQLYVTIADTLEEQNTGLMNVE